MTTVVTCKIVKNGLIDPLMRKVATKIAEDAPQSKTNTDHRIQPTGKATEQADASNGSESTSNGHTKTHGKRVAERNAIRKEKRDEEGKEATDMPRMQATRQHIYRPRRQAMLVQHASTQRQHTIMQMVHMVQETGPRNRELLGTGRSLC
jgi:hypothetical protein